MKVSVSMSIGRASYQPLYYIHKHIKCLLCFISIFLTKSIQWAHNGDICPSVCEFHICHNSTDFKEICYYRSALKVVM